ncbi:MAG: tetratricopeptide repeat protein [Bacteroidia bacterium]|nr:tetratricopeptide repeat protein [Bacteroidia bacterium]
MTQSPSSTSASAGTFARLGVVALGAIVCGLLFFADKTSLENKVEAGLIPTAAKASTGISLDQLPPLGTDAELEALQREVSESEGEERIKFIDSFTTVLEKRGRLDYAAVYAAEALSISPDSDRKINTGLLSQRATSLPFIKNDTALSAYFNSTAIRLLEEAKDEMPNREDVLLGLGLAYVNSGKPENSMKGILTIRSVLDINPNNIDAAYQLGMFSIQTGQFEKAVERFESVLTLDPSRQDANLGLASALINLGQTARAIPLLEEVVQKSKDNELRLQAGAMLENIH